MTDPIQDIDDRIAALAAELSERGPDALEDLRESDPELLALVVEEIVGALVEQKAEENKEAPAALEISLKVGESEQQALARVVNSPEFLAASSISMLSGSNQLDVDLTSLIAEIESHAKLANSRSLRSSSMLNSQAQTLNALFHSLIRRAHSNIVEGYGEPGREYLKLAMRTQAQCRITLESIDSINNPGQRQTNIAHGHQQVNNYSPSEKPPNELMDDGNG